MDIIGKQFINVERVASSKETFRPFCAETGTSLPYTFYAASEVEVCAAARAAAAAYPEYRLGTPGERAAFLDLIADKIVTTIHRCLQGVVHGLFFVGPAPEISRPAC